MASNNYNMQASVFEELSIPFWKREAVDYFLQAMHNITAGTAVVSKKILSETCLEFKIKLSSNSPVIILQYESTRDDNETVRMIPVVDYKIMDENSGIVDDSVIIKHESIVPFHERKEKFSQLSILKQEIPELLLDVNDSEEIKDKSIEDDQAKVASSEMNINIESVSHSLNNFIESESSSSGRELITINGSVSNKVILQTEEEEEHGTYDDERQNNRSEGINYGIDLKKGMTFERKSLKEQQKRIQSIEKPGMFGKSGKHLTPLHNLIEYKKVNTVGKRYMCDECGKSFTFQSNLSRHQSCHQRVRRGEKPFECEDCGMCFTRLMNLKRHQRIHTVVKPFKCDVCGKYFDHLSILTEHQRIHVSETPFKCDKCDKTFGYLNNLIYHKSLHTDVKPFTCEICSESFINSHNLNCHKRIHAGEFICDVCDKSFARSDGLTQHKKVHTGEKPFKCNICGKSFAQLNTLTQHQRTHTGERPFKCEHCDKTFTFLSNLNYHKNIHTGVKPYKCEICSKSFPNSYTLNCHKRTHTNEKSIVCDVCGKSFTRPDSLTQHKKIHTGERPFKCDVCGKSFLRRTHLRSHENKIHSK